MAEKTSGVPRTGWFVVVGALLLIGAWLRFTALDQLALFVDEGGHILGPIAPDVRRVINPIAEGKPGITWFFFPATLTQHPLVVARAMVGMCGLITAAAIATSLFVLFDATAAVIGLGLWLVLPFTVFHERLALFDPMIATLAALGLAAWVIGARPTVSSRSRFKWQVFGGLCAGSACLLKISALSTAPWLLVCYVVVHRRWHQPVLTRNLVATALAFCLPTLLLFIAAPNLGERILHPIDRAVPVEGWPILRWYVGYGGWLLGALGLSAFIAAWRRQVTVVGWIAMAWLMSVLFAEVLYPVPYARYLHADHIPLVLSIAGALAFSSTRIRLPIAIAALAAGLYLDVRIIYDPRTAPLPRDEIAQYVTGLWSGEGTRQVLAALETRRPCVVFVHRYSRPGSYFLILATRGDPALSVVPLSLETETAILGAKSVVAKARQLIGPKVDVYLLAEGAPPPEPVFLRAAGVSSTVILDHVKPDGRSHLTLLRCEF